MATSSRIKTKWQLTLVALVVTALLGFYTLGALWEYADTLNSTNGWMLKVGFCACEFMVGVWAIFHIWRRWVWTRLVCLGLATGMGIFLVVHSSAVSKYVAAKREAHGQSKDLAQGIASVTQSAAQGIVTGAGTVAQRQRQSGAPNTARGTIATGTKQAAELGVQNAQVLADTALKLEEQAKGSTFLSAEYMNGKMQAVVFTALLLGVGIMFLVFELGKAEEDDDDDGVPNFADGKSQYYDKDRAAKWWGDRGQLAPHQLNQPQPQPQPQPSQVPQVPTYNHGAGDGSQGALYSFSPEGVLQRVDHGLSQDEARRRARVDAAREIGERRLAGQGQFPTSQQAAMPQSAPLNPQSDSAPVRPTSRLSRMLRRFSNRPK